MVIVLPDELALDALLDLLDGIEAGIAQARQRVREAKLPQEKPRENLEGVFKERNREPTKLDWNPDKITWERAKGPSGEYEKTPTLRGSPSQEEIAEYKKMIKDLEAHRGNLWRDNIFYWLFTDQVTVGRKQKATKP
jgi:hypothetical protein